MRVYDGPLDVIDVCVVLESALEEPRLFTELSDVCLVVVCEHLVAHDRISHLWGEHRYMYVHVIVMSNLCLHITYYITHVHVCKHVYVHVHTYTYIVYMYMTSSHMYIVYNVHVHKIQNSQEHVYVQVHEIPVKRVNTLPGVRSSSSSQGGVSEEPPHQACCS